MRSNELGQERLLVTCSPLLRNVSLSVIESALRGQALLDPNDGKWYEVGDTRIDTEHHKIYGIVIENVQMNSLGQQEQGVKHE